jgi:very-short-patch-repair endonuclease
MTIKLSSSQEIRVCIQCNTEFISWKSNKRRVHCSHKCARKTVGNKNKTGANSACKVCGTNIYISTWEKTKKYCSRECANQAQTVPLVEVKCSNEYCDNTCTRSPKQLQRIKEKNISGPFCSVKCNNVHRSQKASTLRIVLNTRPELKFKSLLEQSNIEFVFQKSLPWKRGWKKWYDFYIPSLNLLIEVDGIYWHGKGVLDKDLDIRQRQSRENDILKNTLALELGYNLLRIWEDDLDKFNINTIYSYDKK